MKAIVFWKNIKENVLTLGLRGSTIREINGIEMPISDDSTSAFISMPAEHADKFDINTEIDGIISIKDGKIEWS